MFSRIYLSPIIGVLFSSLLFSQTTVPGGYVSGTWTSSGSPYNVQGNITIHSDSTLIIEPGVVVEFLNFSFLLVNGFLEAIGSETDSILFSGAYWMGLDFRDAPDSSHLTYCIVQNVEDWASPLLGGITCMNCNPVISHCRISNNAGGSELWGAGGIILSNSNANIRWCSIRCNTIISALGGTGGGIKIKDSHPTITGCDISGNDGDYRGGGIDMFGTSSLIISDCAITDNLLSTLSPGMGGGIASQGSDITMTECTISRNVGGPLGGGGIWISGGSAVITSCTIDSNRTTVHLLDYGPGGGICADCDSLQVDHCTLVGNAIAGDYSNMVGWEIHTEGTTSLILTNSILKGREFGAMNLERLVVLYGTSADICYSDFYNYRLPNPFWINLPPGLGEPITINANGDSCDVYYNIFLDPLFVDYPNADYRLTQDSPCIDAGDPMSPNDPDGTVTDMGRCYFDQSTPVVPSAINDLTISCDSVNAYINWSPVTTDTSGNPITVSRYVIYASDNPLFMPMPSDSMGYTIPPDSSFTDSDALIESKRFYSITARVEN